MGIKYIDIGLNLFSRQYAGREDEIVRDASEAGVGIIITGSSETSSSLAAGYVRDHEGIYATAGIHPHDAKSFGKDTMARLRSWISENPRIVAVGECGLDYDRMYSPKEVQLEVFERQVELAEELGKPLFLHEREASADFATILKRHRTVCERAVVHCFTGNAATAEEYLSLGCRIGITGWVCDERRNADLLEALSTIPANRLMAETDGPYLKPRIRGLKDPNRPEYIVHVVRRIAEIKGLDEEVLRAQILKNTREFFGI